jgi:hypothetical protein
MANRQIPKREAEIPVLDSRQFPEVRFSARFGGIWEFRFVNAGDDCQEFRLIDFRCLDTAGWSMDSQSFRPRKGLSADGLFALVRNQFETVKDPRSGLPTIPLGDALLAAFAMFSLKCASLLAFDKCRAGGDCRGHSTLPCWLEQIEGDKRAIHVDDLTVLVLSRCDVA